MTARCWYSPIRLASDLHMWDKVLPLLENRLSDSAIRHAGARKEQYSAGPLHGRAARRRSAFPPRSSRARPREPLRPFARRSGSMWIGIHSPERIDRMILANTAASFGPPERWDERIAMVQSLGMEPIALATLERLFTPVYREQHPEEMQTACRMIAATNAVGYAGCCGALRDADVRREIAAIEAPCLVIVGAHDQATPPSEGQALHSALPKLQPRRARCVAPFRVGETGRIRRRSSRISRNKGAQRWMKKNATRRECACGEACLEMSTWIAPRQRRTISMRISRTLSRGMRGERSGLAPVCRGIREACSRSG